MPVVWGRNLAGIEAALETPRTTNVLVTSYQRPGTRSLTSWVLFTFWMMRRVPATTSVIFAKYFFHKVCEKLTRNQCRHSVTIVCQKKVDKIIVFALQITNVIFNIWINQGIFLTLTAYYAVDQNYHQICYKKGAAKDQFLAFLRNELSSTINKFFLKC